MRRFPIMAGWSHRADAPVEWIPWELIAPHEAQALLNHDQTLERLAQRGGLDALEAVAVLEDKDYRKRWPQPSMTREIAQEITRQAHARLQELCANYFKP